VIVDLTPLNEDAVTALAAALESRTLYHCSPLDTLYLRLPRGLGPTLGRLLRAPACGALSFLYLHEIEDDGNTRWKRRTRCLPRHWRVGYAPG
jgi:hypothetical protein